MNLIAAHGRSKWQMPGAHADYDFMNDRLWLLGGFSSTAFALSLTRTAAGMAQWQNGLWSSFGANILRRTDKGALIEEARTNNLLWCRDMTNAAWTKGATATVAQTQTGIDGAANSATLVTGGAVQATNTVLQAITLGSAAHSYSIFVKRVTGSGTIEITVDGGTTWTAIVPTSTYQQFQVQKSAANPSCGVRIATNGDQIACDFSQLESGSFATSPIATTTATVTRDAENVIATGAAATMIPLCKSMFFQTAGVQGITTFARIVNLGSAFIGYSSTTVARATDNVNQANATIGGAGVVSGTVKSAYGLDDVSMTAISNNGTLVTQSTSTWATTAAGQPPNFGNFGGLTRALNGYLQRAAFAYPKGIFDSFTA